MKVSRVGSTSSTSGTRRTTSVGGTGGDFAKHLTEALDGASEANGPDGVGRVSGVGALLATQSVGDATEREARRRMVQHGEDILDRLEEIRHALLTGGLDESQLLELADRVRSRREAVSDPRLSALLDEIELRAEVELAKLSRNG